MNRILIFLTLCLASFPMSAGIADTLDVQEKKSERNMMLNAESATVPREINIGLPEGGNGAIVYVDGAKHAHGLPRSQFHWSGGNAYSSTGSIGLMEAVITSGEIGVLVDSRTRLGTDDFSGAFTVGSSTNGLIRFDGAVGGALKNADGWYYSLGAYVNNDPTNVNAPNRPFVDQKQIYHLAMSRRWEHTTLDALYRFSYCRDNIDNGYGFAPFVYNGDGTIDTFNGFRIGRDCYVPEDDAVSYMDIRDGRIRYGSLGNMDERFIHDISVMAEHNHASGWRLGANLHVMHMQPSRYVKMGLAGIDHVTQDKGFTDADGAPFSGYVQNRLVTVEDQTETDVNLILSADRRFNSRHKLRLGMELVWSDQLNYASTFYYAHTVEAGPSRIHKDGKATWGMNTSGLYYDAYRLYAPIYAVHDWNPVPRLLLRTGARVRPLYQNVMTAAKLDGDSLNSRVDGFNIADRSMCEPHELSIPAVDYAFSEHVSYRIAGRLFFMAEGFYSMTTKSASYYKNATIPSTAPIGNALGRGGFTYDNSWMDVTALVSYITSWNNAKVMTVTKQVAGVSETIPWTAQYGIGTLGVTLDGNLHWGGFNMHLLGTWQDPRYKNYKNEFVFSDGTTEVIDYTGNHVTGISRFMLEIDPSFSWDRLRIWASARYYSRQYVSRTNLAYFSGHWETFAGIDWKVTPQIKVSANLVNILAQNGAKGSIDAADTITDASLLNGIVMSGSYIRPFTIDFMLTYSF
ncbi:MAG: hypothetical protein IJ394_00425 [Bacteroidales bacterium]|nr:hypothetical protein [Bacteroidales bacterium]